MSKQAQAKRTWLDEVKEDAAKATLRRLEDDGLGEFSPDHEEKENAINAAEARAAKAQDAEVVKKK